MITNKLGGKMKKKVTGKKASKKNQYAVVRTTSAGVFAGEIVSRKGQEVVIKNARRLWYWKGAASLSQLSQEGVKCPAECKFPAEVPEVILTQAIEILPATEMARKSIEGVPVWRM